jgi:RimJ/RimL family protein N-acetyltransferase
LFLQYIKDHHPHCQALQLTVHPENQRAQHLYTGAGFRPTDTQMDGEPVYRLALSSMSTSCADFQDAMPAYQTIEPRYRDANRRLTEQA